jgi:NADH:ubiquinone reductase (H+-translocating)
VAHWLGVSGGRGGRIEVNEDLTVPGHPDIFVIGDAASLTGPSGCPLPGLAPVAKQQGRYVAELIKRRLRGQPPPPPFRYHDEGSLAVIGRASAVADLGQVKLTGWVAWLLWGAVHIFFLISFRHRVAVFFNWFWSWLTYSSGARIITGESKAGAGAGLRADEGLPSKPEAS